MVITMFVFKGGQVNSSFTLKQQKLTVTCTLCGTHIFLMAGHFGIHYCKLNLCV